MNVPNAVKKWRMTATARNAAMVMSTRVGLASTMDKYVVEVENSGFVEIKILSDLDLWNIQVIILPAGEINQLYFDNKKMDVKRLNY